VIGEETSQRLDVIPAQFRVVVTHRPKYACRACEQAVVQAPATREPGSESSARFRRHPLLIALARQYGRYAIARSPNCCARRAGQSTTTERSRNRAQLQ